MLATNMMAREMPRGFGQTYISFTKPLSFSQNQLRTPRRSRRQSRRPCRPRRRGRPGRRGRLGRRRTSADL